MSEIRVVFRLKPGEYIRLPVASECEKAIKKEIERLSEEKLELIARGWGTESPNVIDGSVTEKTEYLDYEVIFNDKSIAIMETSCTYYTFDPSEACPKGSKFFPINAYKAKRKEKLPVFFVYSLELEPSELCNRCWWITLEKALDNLLRPDPMWLQTRMPNGKYKPQLNYLTDKYAWTNKLQTLVDELLKISF